MNENSLRLTITLLVILFLIGGLAFVLYKYGRDKVDKLDKSENVVSLQQWGLSWWGVLVLLIFGSQLLDFAYVIGTAIYYENKGMTVKIEYVDHLGDLLIYGVKMLIWGIPSFFVWVADIFVDIPKKTVVNPPSVALFFSWKTALILCTLFWVWLKKDNKWNIFVRIFAYLGSLIFVTLLLANFWFKETRRALPRANVIEYYGRTIWKDASVNAAAPAPAEYSTQGQGTSETASLASKEFMGLEMFYWYIIGGVILLILVYLFFFRRKKSAPAPASAGQPKAAASGGDGDASTTSGPAEHTPQHESKKYALAEFMLDKDALRRLIVLFRQYDTSCFYMLDVSKIYDMLNNMQAFLLTIAVHSDSFHATDNKEIDALRSLISSNIAGNKLPAKVPGASLDPGTYGEWASFMGQVMGAYSDGFHMRAGGYGAAVNNLGQYRKALAAQADVELKMIPPNITDRKDPTWSNYNQLLQMINMVNTWIAQLTAAYKPHYGEIQVPGIQVSQPPGAMQQWINANPKPARNIGIALVLILLFVILYFWIGGGCGKKEVEPGVSEQVQTEQAVPQLSEKEFKRQKKILNTNLDLIVDALCAGQPAPADAKEKAMTAAAKLGATAQQLNDEVRNRRQKKCPPTTEKKE